MARRSFVVVAVLLLAVGCSADQKGAAPPPPVTSTAAATPASTPTPVASPTPFVSTADEAGAFAFVREYFKRLDVAYATGDVEPVKPLRTQSCVSCLQFERQIKDAYSRGHLEAEPLVIERLGFGQSGPAFAKIGVQFRTAAVRSVARDGSVTVSPPTRGTYFVTLTRTDDHWVVDRLTGEVTQS